MTKKHNKQAYSLQKQCSFDIFLIGTGIDPCFIYRDSQEWQQSSPQSPKPYSPSHARKSFHSVLSCLVMMYHQTNLDCKSFSISEDLVETIVALTLNIIKWYSGWWWCITILSLTDQRYCPGKHSLKFRTFTVTLTLNTAKQPFHKTLQLMNMHRQTKLVAPKNQQFRTYNRNSHIWLYEPKFSYCDLDREDRNPFFVCDALVYNVSPYRVWLQMVQRCVSSKLTLTKTFNLGCDIDLEHSSPTFSLDSSLLMMVYTQIEFGCKRLTGLELMKDIVETVIFYKLTLYFMII